MNLVENINNNIQSQTNNERGSSVEQGAVVIAHFKPTAKKRFDQARELFTKFKFTNGV